MSRILTIAAITVFAVALLSVAGSPLDSNAAFPGANGKIVFIDGVPAGVRHIWSMDPDGANRTQLTFGTVEDYSPTWSPDGTKIAFVRETAGQGDLMLMDADGGNLAPIPGGSDAYDPAFSPGGSQIAFEKGSDIWTMDLDGTNATNITQTPDDEEGDPAWSPDGTRIAASNYHDGDNSSEILVMDADGGNRDIVTNTDTVDEGNPDWAPDSSRLVFGGIGGAGPLVAGAADADIAFIDPDGSNYQPITDADYQDYNPKFSPDGTKIVVSGYIDQTQAALAVSSYVMTMNPNGGGRVNISGSNSADGGPNWGPVATAATPTPTETDSPSHTATPTPAPSETPDTTPSPTDTGEATPAPTGTPTAQTLTWGDNNCADGPNPVDSLLTLRHNAGLSANTGNCPPMGESLDFQIATVYQWGDVDCGGVIDAVDSLKLLRFDADLSVTQEANCPEIGSQVQVQP